MEPKLKKGDSVSWNTSQGKTRGKIVKRLTSAIQIKGYVAAASKKNPEYLVKSDKTGARAAHKADVLKKV